MKYLVANWKSHKTGSEAKNWQEKVSQAPFFTQLNEGKIGNLQVVVCPGFSHLEHFQGVAPQLTLGVQTLSPFPDGSYTGAVSARMVADLAQFAILGHVERRTNFHETNQEVAQQTVQAVENGLTPIIAVDKSNWSSQLAMIEDEHLQKCLVMYEPAEAISTSNQGHSADLAEVVEASGLIKTEYPVKGVLYGGSVDEKNISHYLNESAIDGVVVGAASLDATQFISVVDAALQVVNQ